MDTLHFNKLLLKTAFSCMACDGNIDRKEINLIKRLQKERKTFGEIDINRELDTLIRAINKDGHQFLKEYFNELANIELTEADEMNLIEVAIDIIKADEKVEYNEIKFFKVIRSKLKIKDGQLLEKHPDFEDYLEQDIITDIFSSRLQDDFFNTQISKVFELISEIDENIVEIMKDENKE